MLTGIWHGCQRDPALLYQQSTAKLGDLNLDKHEMLLGERLHDVSGHTEDIIKELPEHINTEHADLFSETVSLREKTLSEMLTTGWH